MAGAPPCPICGSSERRDALGREDAVCADCGALERHRALARECAPLLSGGGRCLEAGPANRRVYGEFLRERGWEYRSLDRWRTGNPVDPRPVAFIDHEADLTNLSIFADGEFDLVIAQEVIEEIEDYGRALDEIARVLRPGGTALLEIRFDQHRERSERQPPDRFGNVWAFGSGLLNELRSRFGQVESLEVSEGHYRGTLHVCTVDPPLPVA